MTRLAVTYPDAEQLVTEYLRAQFDERERDATVSTNVPPAWQQGVSDKEHLQVVSDGVADLNHPIVAHHTIRLIARAKTRAKAVDLLQFAYGLLLAHPGGDGIAVTRSLTGVLPERDPQTNAELAAATARVSVRSTPIEP